MMKPKKSSKQSTSIDKTYSRGVNGAKNHWTNLSYQLHYIFHSIYKLRWFAGDSYSGAFLDEDSSDPIRCLCMSENCRGYIVSKRKAQELKVNCYGRLFYYWTLSFLSRSDHPIILDFYHYVISRQRKRRRLRRLARERHKARMRRRMTRRKPSPKERSPLSLSRTVRTPFLSQFHPMHSRQEEPITCLEKDDCCSRGMRMRLS